MKVYHFLNVVSGESRFFSNLKKGIEYIGGTSAEYHQVYRGLRSQPEEPKALFMENGDIWEITKYKVH